MVRSSSSRALRQLRLDVPSPGPAPYSGTFFRIALRADAVAHLVPASSASRGRLYVTAATCFPEGRLGPETATWFARLCLSCPASCAAPQVAPLIAPQVAPQFARLFAGNTRMLEHVANAVLSVSDIVRNLANHSFDNVLCRRANLCHARYTHATRDGKT